MNLEKEKTRREFLKGLGCIATALVVGGCRSYEHKGDVNQQQFVYVPTTRRIVVCEEPVVESRGQFGNKIFDGKIGDYDVIYWEDYSPTGDGRFCNYMHFEFRGEKYDLFDLKDFTSIFSGEDFTSDKLEKIWISNRHVDKMIYRSDAGIKSFEEREIRKNFQDGDRFYNEMRDKILGRLNLGERKDSENTRKVEKENVEVKRAKRDYSVLEGFYRGK